ncbi:MULTISPECIES: hypothetical protein [Halomonadaceae]|jgi:hypothetical protein|uniref:hypothetical protein n=1 Tax=Halomonadaceae TaxID=28256 RepID=UPI000348132E|nr:MULTISPECIES: hypothetical protein [Halomonas]NAO96489.1 hypothetical protein [Halomonas sp. MG34]MCD1586298.1 hypothetical protein [Halomonas sp. IOP_14]MCE7516805.1 hypothetical protein [Halomonas titanicae]NVE90909.1 hypothetical protein [Halomonas titanicae]QNU62497.1 hypothetical protein HZS52_22655 [Halomonas titanicae]|tara:strand:+ start:2562 stop:2738 length:177 start_codon:yes stop_codon:yes gene_type:complete
MTLLSSRGHIHFLDLIPPALGCAFLGNARLVDGGGIQREDSLGSAHIDSDDAVVQQSW